MDVMPTLAVAPVQSIGLPIVVLLCWLPYWVRARSLASAGRSVPRWRQICFASGRVVLEIALSPPVDTLSDQLLVGERVHRRAERDLEHDQSGREADLTPARHRPSGRGETARTNPVGQPAEQDHDRQSDRL